MSLSSASVTLSVDNIAYAYERLCDKLTHIFLSGDAGSGKSTLIREFILAHEGKCLVCAPTGLAAINIEGSTIHSLFGFPTVPLSYSSIKKLDPLNDIDIDRIAIFRAAEYLIIDEISMTRADLMDQIAWFFFKNSKVICGQEDKPFAGLKVIMIGDLSQLEPVVATEKEKDMLQKRYRSSFFFDADCWNPERHASFETIKLTKIWRQNDPYFIGILNEIKYNKLSPFTIDAINSRCYKMIAGRAEQNDGIMLCSRNDDAAKINTNRLSAHDGTALAIRGTVYGTFPQSQMPVELTLNLKIGCRIMLVRNSNEYYNGSMGTIVGYDSDNIKIDTSQGFPIEIEDPLLEVMLDIPHIPNVNEYSQHNINNTTFVSLCTFENIDYEYDEAEDKLHRKVIGKFKQFPVKLAYAISIHKSQGQTYDKVNIDFGQYGAFAHGQAYVAISRCKSIDGIRLMRPMKPKDVIVSKRVDEFINKK